MGTVCIVTGWSPAPAAPLPSPGLEGTVWGHSVYQQTQEGPPRMFRGLRLTRAGWGSLFVDRLKRGGGVSFCPPR
jgi:hypothetical protein